MKQKFLLFLDSLVDLILEAIYVAAFVVCAYGLSLLVKHTIGEKWTGIAETIRHGALLGVGALGTLQFVITIAARTYQKVKKELKDEHDRNP